MPTPLDLLSDLDLLLERSPKDLDHVLAMSKELRKSLLSLGYTSTSSVDYTLSRALVLRDTATTLLEHVNSAGSLGYSDRAYLLSTVGDMYLRVAHAFKIDSVVWAQAQSDLVPFLFAARDAASIDKALEALRVQLSYYLSALNVWLA